MTRILFVVTVVVSVGVAHAQDGGVPVGGGQAGGGQVDGGTGTAVGGDGIETSDLGGQGITTGQTEQTESGFANTEESGFAGPTQQTFRSRTFIGGQARPIVTGGSSQTQRQIRPSFRLGFVPSATMLARSRQRAVSRWVTITPRVTELRGMSFSPDQNGRVTIRGQATSRYGSLLAAAIARLEPGVRSVRNEVQVVPNAGAGTRPQQPTAPQQGTPQPGIAQPAAPVRVRPFASGTQVPANPAPVVPNRAPVRNQTPLRGSIELPVPPLAPQR